MSEWWTYRPSDLLMFAPRTYWRLFELHNEALWPLQVLTALLALFIAGAIARGHPGAVRVAIALLAACWALVAWAFLWQRYAPINSAAGTFALCFALQAGMLVVLALRGGLCPSNDAIRRNTGLALLAWAVLAHPWLAVLSHRPWTEAEVFGLAPDPTAIGTLGVLLCISSRQRSTRVVLFAAWSIACLWCAVSAATLWTMGSAQGWVPAVAAACALAMLARRRA